MQMPPGNRDDDLALSYLGKMLCTPKGCCSSDRRRSVASKIQSHVLKGFGRGFPTVYVTILPSIFSRRQGVSVRSGVESGRQNTNTEVLWGHADPSTECFHARYTPSVSTQIGLMGMTAETHPRDSYLYGLPSCSSEGSSLIIVHHASQVSE